LIYIYNWSTKKEYQKYSKNNKYIHKKYQRTPERNKPPKPPKATTKKEKGKRQLRAGTPRDTTQQGLDTSRNHILTSPY
jgi:hypothetical protein